MKSYKKVVATHSDQVIDKGDVFGGQQPIPDVGLVIYQDGRVNERPGDGSTIVVIGGIDKSTIVFLAKVLGDIQWSTDVSAEVAQAWEDWAKKNAPDFTGCGRSGWVELNGRIVNNALAELRRLVESATSSSS